MYTIDKSYVTYKMTKGGVNKNRNWNVEGASV